jgi:DNA-binding PadR family transcriptional regulator
VNPTRLFVLGALACHGPMYGHQIRRDARIDRTELWSEVKPGSLYSALHRLQAEGLIEPVRTEQQGNLPARTVYGITAEGRRELRALRDEALREVTLRPDPVDLALAMSADLDEDALRGYFASRREALSGRAAFFARERQRALPGQAPADDLIMEHAIARIETELRWHDVVLDRIGKLGAGFLAADPGPGGSAAAGPLAAGPRPVGSGRGKGRDR